MVVEESGSGKESESTSDSSRARKQASLSTASRLLRRLVATILFLRASTFTFVRDRVSYIEIKTSFFFLFLGVFTKRPCCCSVIQEMIL